MVATSAVIALDTPDILAQDTRAPTQTIRINISQGDDAQKFEIHVSDVGAGEGPQIRMRETEEMSEGETDTDVDTSTDLKTDSDEGQLLLAKVVPLECVRISDPGKRGQESYYFPRRQVLPETYKGIFAYGRLDGDTEHPYGYIYLRPSDKDAYDTIAIA